VSTIFAIIPFFSEKLKNPFSRPPRRFLCKFPDFHFSTRIF
jgi:hypothetical protein